MLEKTQGALNFFHLADPAVEAVQQSAKINKVQPQAGSVNNMLRLLEKKSYRSFASRFE